MTGQMAVHTLRVTLGWTQTRLARESGISVRSIYRIERGLVQPLPDRQHRLVRLALAHADHAQLRPLIRTHRIDPERMERYLSPAVGWKHWSWQKRKAFLRCRKWYKQALADHAAGLCLLEYQYRHRAQTPQQRLRRLLDAAPDLDTF